jgi:alkanesulfonate monooxygenase SsuD/methylene tetrahydromethanopterin reductase-like flavin-dependent oxidoreductase (luciferase family)
MQKPHPPIWLPSQGSKDTIEFAAAKRYTYLQTLSSIKDLRSSFDIFREEANKHGYTADASQLGWSVKVYVAETDEQAYAEAEGHIMFHFNNHFIMPQHYLFPPGYIHEGSLARIMQAKAGLGKKDYFNFKDLVEKGYVIVGSPETVRQRIEKVQKELGFGILVVHMHSGNMPNFRTMKNIELFGRHVLPSIQILGN